MGTKNNPGDFDCYENAEPDEPMFVLLARDVDAPALVNAWADAREARGENPAKVAEARQCAQAMIWWRSELRDLIWKLTGFSPFNRGQTIEADLDVMRASLCRWCGRRITKDALVATGFRHAEPSECEHNAEPSRPISGSEGQPDGSGGQR